MYKVLSILVSFLFFSLCYSQSEGWTLASDNYVLKGNLSIHLKSGEIINDNYTIRGQKIKNSDIIYSDIDFIVKDFGIYKYINVGGNKILLLNVEYETNKVSFYSGRPKIVGGGMNANGFFKPSTTKYKKFMLKKGMDHAVKYNFTNEKGFIKKYFSDCPALLNKARNKKERASLTMYNIADIYNGDCEIIFFDLKKVHLNP